jgi:hypothetical protein
MTLVSQLIAVSDAFGAARVLSRSRVSTLVLNDGKRLDAIARGGDLRTAVFERAMAWFSSNWPAGAEWPADVPRPLTENEPTVTAAVSPENVKRTEIFA